MPNGQAKGHPSCQGQGGLLGGGPRRLSPEQIEEARQRVETGVPVVRVAREAGVSRQTLYDALGGRGAYGEGAAKVLLDGSAPAYTCRASF